jgi:hypothetical protein
MPRRRVTWSGRKQGRGIPPGVKAAALADQLAGGRTIAETARAFGLDPLTVKKLADTVSGINSEDVVRIERGLPRLFAVLAAGHATEALKRVEADPALSVKSTFGAKLAAEAGRLVAPAAGNPGGSVLAFIQALHLAGGGSLTVGTSQEPPGPVLEAESLPAGEPQALQPPELPPA